MDGGVVAYTVEMRDESKIDSDWTVIEDQSLQLTLTASGLVPGRSYQFRIISSNSLGASEPSKPVSGKCLDCVPDVVEMPVLVTSEAEYLTVRWRTVNPGVYADEIGDIGYIVEYEGNAPGSWTSFDGEQSSDGSYVSCSITGLSIGRTYGIRVIAYNAYARGEPSKVLKAITKGPPPPVGKPIVSDQSPTSFCVSWHGTGADSYVVEITEGSVIEGPSPTRKQWRRIPCNGIQCKVTDVNPNATYTVRVVSVNDLGESEPSKYVFAKTVSGIPVQPSAPSVIGVGVGHVTMTWAAVHDAEKVDYVLLISTGGIVSDVDAVGYG